MLFIEFKKKGGKLTPTQKPWKRTIEELGFQYFICDEIGQAEKLLQDSVNQMSIESAVLLTQGAMDPVCPVEIARDFFDNLPQVNKRYEEFDDGLHELFSDEGKERLTKVLNDWLDECYEDV